MYDGAVDMALVHAGSGVVVALGVVVLIMVAVDPTPFLTRIKSPTRTPLKIGRRSQSLCEFCSDGPKGRPAARHCD
eukprot:3746824-Pyramimonas_sp.AAC.1